jgi:hypothetical protein
MKLHTSADVGAFLFATALITANKTALQAPLHNPAITLKKTAFREYFRKNAMIFISVNPPFLEIRQVS